MTADFSFKIMDPAAPLGPKADCTIPGYLTERHYKCNPTKFNNLLMARTVLDAPLLVFEGVREFNEGGLVFRGAAGPVLFAGRCDGALVGWPRVRCLSEPPAHPLRVEVGVRPGPSDSVSQGPR